MDVQMKSLDKKLHREGFESPQAVHSPRQCVSPSEISQSSTAHPTPSPEPERDQTEQPVELITTLPPARGDNVTISVSLSPEMIEQIGSGGQIRFALHLNPDGTAAMQDEPETPPTTLACDNSAKRRAWDCVSPAPEEAHTLSYLASSTPVAARAATQAEESADDADHMAGMTDEELIAMLAGCAAAPAKDGSHASCDAVNAAAEQSMILCMDDDSSVTDACAFLQLDSDGCENALDALQGLVCESHGDDDEHSRLWSEDLLGLC